MIRHIWSVFCSKGSVDQQTNSVSLFEIIEEMHLQVPEGATFPAVIPFEAMLVTLWTRGDPSVSLEGQQRIRFLGPDGGELGSFPGLVPLESAPRSRSFARFNQIRLGGPGRHEWEVCCRATDKDPWQEVARIPVDLTISFTKEAEHTGPTNEIPKA